MDGTTHAESDGGLAEFLRLRTDYLAARDRVATAHVALADQIADVAHRKMPRRVRRDEVRAEAYWGLLEAVDRFDGRGRFRGFASQRIVQRLQDWARKRTAHPMFSLNELVASFDR